MIKLSQALNPFRETTALFDYIDDDGNSQTKEIRVQYRDLTVKEIKESQAKLKAITETDPDAKTWLSESLADRSVLFPDILDENGKPAQITGELLEAFGLKNLRAINKAIEEDINPK